MKRSGPERSKASSLVTCSQPSPSLPIRFSSGIKASVKVTSFQSCRPARLMIGRMVTGQLGLENLSGPINIAQYAGYSAQIGLVSYLGFLAVISISLGVLNLLPVPVLDGGHLAFYLVEWVRGRPLSERIQQWGQQLGVVALVLMMGLAFYNDLVRLLAP